MFRGAARMIKFARWEQSRRRRRTMRDLTMRMPLLAIAVLISASAAALADDLPQADAAGQEPAQRQDMTEGQVSGPTGPVKIIDAAPATPAAPTDKADQSPSALPPASPPPDCT